MELRLERVRRARPDVAPGDRTLVEFALGHDKRLRGRAECPGPIRGCECCECAPTFDTRTKPCRRPASDARSGRPADCARLQTRDDRSTFCRSRSETVSRHIVRQVPRQQLARRMAPGYGAPSARTTRHPRLGVGVRDSGLDRFSAADVHAPAVRRPRTWLYVDPSIEREFASTQATRDVVYAARFATALEKS